MWLGTRVCSVQCTVSCDSGGLSSASKPAPPPSRVPPPAKFRDSVTAPPQKAHRGECLLLGRGREGWPGLQCLEGGGGDPCLSSTFSLPGPTLPAHSPGRLSGEAPMCTGGCLRLPSPPPPFPALRLLSHPFCQARPRWEISLGTFTPDRVLIA